MTDETISEIDVHAAAERLRGVLGRTPLEPNPWDDERIELRLKLECLQETGSFKSRGAWNQVSQVPDERRSCGVVAMSSGNHGRAVAWAARRAKLKVTLFMPENTYPNKVQACRDEGAEIVLCDSRSEAERRCFARHAAGATLIHPYDAVRTIEGAGTVGLEIAEEWPEVEVVLVPVGGGGLIAGCALALHAELGRAVRLVGVEPEGSPNLSRALSAGEPVLIDTINTKVQGLCPPASGVLNVAIAEEHVEGVITLTDEEIFAGQSELVAREYVVEPAGAAAFAALGAKALPEEWLEGRTAEAPLRICCVISGGNPDPAQLERLRG